jgi:hypothetical protein
VGYCRAMVGMLTTIRKGIGGDIDHPHDQGAVEGQPEPAAGKAW